MLGSRMLPIEEHHKLVRLAKIHVAVEEQLMGLSILEMSDCIGRLLCKAIVRGESDPQTYQYLRGRKRTRSMVY